MSEAQITPEVIKALQLSAKAQEFEIPDGGTVIVTPDGKFQVFHPEKQEEKVPFTVQLTSLHGLTDFLGHLSKRIVTSPAASEQEAVAQAQSELARDASNLFIAIKSPTLVYLINRTDPVTPHVMAQCAPNGIPEIKILEEGVDLDEALVEIQNSFLTDAESQKLVDVLSNVEMSDLVQLKDSGVSREVKVVSRVSATSGKEEANVTGLKLTPIRTFPEVEAILGEFAFRWWRRSEKSVSARLVERQHALWQYAQHQAIKRYIEKDLTDAGLPVLPVLV